ncbi:SCO family protein [Pseudozobellia thermophila]|uniref:Protein SCO1/2 n=1 Tax=Pseudozobellia thermophila TaxID=192903 RepID=A0A1M6GLS3_9FLAO|nr:SCO family protein [Pseudozobellia thermophila]SHJ10871.1 protein SCO1/2 [Pseudozobellia thermophila]
MKNATSIIMLLLLLANLSSCRTKNEEVQALTGYQCPMKCEGDQVYEEGGNCPICHMALQPVEPKVGETKEISDLSIYNLPSVWTTQDHKKIELIDLKGHVVVMVMIYTSCQAACPRLAADMRHIEAQIPQPQKERVKFVLVSIDPETDTPERLKKFAIENKMDTGQWVFLTGSPSDTREFAAVLAVNYKQISPSDFSHSNIISVFDQQGELAYQKEGLGANHGTTVAKIRELAQ